VLGLLRRLENIEATLSATNGFDTAAAWLIAFSGIWGKLAADVGAAPTLIAALNAREAKRCTIAHVLAFGDGE
jgi:hypothetical protein